MQRPLRQTRTRKPFPESVPVTKNGCCRQRHAARNVVVLSYRVKCRNGADAQRLPGYNGKACLLSGHRACLPAHRAGYRRTGAAGPRAEFKVCRAHPAVPPVEIYGPRQHCCRLGGSHLENGSMVSLSRCCCHRDRAETVTPGGCRAWFDALQKTYQQKPSRWLQTAG